MPIIVAVVAERRFNSSWGYILLDCLVGVTLQHNTRKWSVPSGMASIFANDTLLCAHVRRLHERDAFQTADRTTHGFSGRPGVP